MKSGLGSRPWSVVPLCIGMHVTFAIAYLYDPTVARITPLYSAHLLFGGAMWVVLLGASLCATVPILIKLPARYLHVLLWPQQLLLFLAMASAVRASLTGVYPDGYEASSGIFIYADQCVQIYLMLTHFNVIIRNARLAASD